MSNFLDEEVPPVNPLGVEAIQELAECFLEQLAPRMLKRPEPLDVLNLADLELPKFGIHTVPACREELGNRDGATDPRGKDQINILIFDEVWENLPLENQLAYYPRSTVCHEIAHAVLHVPVLRRRMLLDPNAVLSRTMRRNLAPYEDPEWQAWMFAGEILMPKIALNKLEEKGVAITAKNLSEAFLVSVAFAEKHLKRVSRFRVR